MITTRLDRDDSWLPGVLRRVFQYLRTHDFSSMEPGEYPIEGKDLFARVFTLETKDITQCKAEFHDIYLDVQYWVEGEELLGCSERQGNEPIVGGNPKDDLYYCPVADEESRVYTRKGDVVIFFPTDIHRPGGAWNGRSVTCRKVVVKVRASLLGGA